jgi:raffinose/stachyose/melibiose transport system substrate-binding protein
MEESIMSQNEQLFNGILADGTPIDDNAIYTVAALATTIDASYITETIKQFSEVGTPQEMMTNYITAAGTIAPAKDGRITLNWSK